MGFLDTGAIEIGFLEEGLNGEWRKGKRKKKVKERARRARVLKEPLRFLFFIKVD